MKCKDCVLCEQISTAGNFAFLCNCSYEFLYESGEHDIAKLGNNLNRDCQRNDERLTKLREQMER